MASQRDIRRRIASVRNIKQITRAMQFVAASKLKRAQEATLAVRPYCDQAGGGPRRPCHRARRRGPPAARPARGRQTADRARHARTAAWPARSTPTPSASRPARSPSTPATWRSSRWAARDATRCAGPASPIEAHFAGFGDRPTFADVLPLARLVSDDFLAGTYGRVDVIYSRFVSTLIQRPVDGRPAPDPPLGGHRGHPGQPVHLRAVAGRGAPDSFFRATSPRGSTRPCWRPRPARSPAGWSR